MISEKLLKFILGSCYNKCLERTKVIDEGVTWWMLEVRVNDGESVEKALSRFKKKCEKEQLIKEIKKRERYEKPSERRRQKLLKAQRKNRRNYRHR